MATCGCALSNNNSDWYVTTPCNSLSLWAGWNEAYVTAAGSANNVATVTLNDYCQAAWPAWNQIYVADATGSGHVTYTPVPETQEQEQARQDSYTAQVKARQEAAAKAEILLLSFLTEEQKAQYKQSGYFETLSNDNKRYRIKKGRSGNVKELNDQGREVYSFCGHPAEAVPDQDTMLVQLLMLTTDAEAFRRIANRTIC
jgi:hypothetical protein